MNILKITSEDADELLNTSAFGAGALIRVESATSSGGTFAEIGTVALVAATYLYTYYDQTAATGLYYRTRYSNSGNTNRSDYSDEFQATAASGLYCSLYDAKQRLGIAATDTTDDENLLQFCVEATALIKGFTHRDLAPTTLTAALYDGYDAVEDGRCLLIPDGIRSISLLEIATNTGATFTTVASGDYFIRPTAQERDPGWPGTEVWITDIPSSSTTTPYFPPGFANIRITGTGGWSATPDEIASVALNTVVAKWRGRGAGGGDTFTIGGDGERTFTRYLSFEDKATLKRYQLRSLVVV